MGGHCDFKGFPLDQCAKVTSAPPILEEIWCFQSGLVLHESHPYGENTSVLGNRKPPTSIIQRKRAGPKGSAPVLLIIRIEKRLTALQVISLVQGGVSNRQVGTPPAGPTKFSKSALSTKLKQNFRNFGVITGNVPTALWQARIRFRS